MAMISLNLGLLNLMPIPVLDGGHIFIMALEGLARRDFSMQVKEKMLLAGFVLLLMLMVTVIYNDLTRIGWIRTAGAVALASRTSAALLRLLPLRQPRQVRFRGDVGLVGPMIGFVVDDPPQLVACASTSLRRSGWRAA